MCKIIIFARKIVIQNLIFLNNMKLTRLLTLFFPILMTSCVSSKDGSAIRNYINELKNQYPIPEMSQAEMYADFDTFTSIMVRCNPQHLVRKKATGYDMVAEMKAQRVYVESCENTVDFIKLLEKCLALSLDPHCTFGGNTVWHYKYTFYKKEIEMHGITDRDFGINFHYISDIYRKERAIINLIYIQGKYFLKHTTHFFNGTDTIVAPAGTELLSFNQQPIGNIQSVPTNWYSCWDFDKKMYYNTMLYVTNPQNSISLKENGTIKECAFTEFSQIKRDIEEKGYLTKWIEKDSVIYITIPAMNYYSTWLKQLKSELLQYKKKPIRAVIVDIRDNWGGNDNTWIEVLGMVSNTAIEFPYHYICTMDDEVIKRVMPEDKNLVLEQETSKSEVEYIDSQHVFRLRTEGTNVIKNHKKNLGYEGTIYVLVDEGVYSSAGAFKSLCTKTDRIKTIGVPTGKFLGAGLNPSVFMLPNSRLIFRMELVLDATGVTKAEDFYHDHVNYPFTPSIEYYKYWYDPARPYNIDENTMYEHDEVFKKALEIIRE